MAVEVLLLPLMLLLMLLLRCLVPVNLDYEHHSVRSSEQAHSIVSLSRSSSCALTIPTSTYPNLVYQLWIEMLVSCHLADSFCHIRPVSEILILECNLRKQHMNK